LNAANLGNTKLFRKKKLTEWQKKKVKRNIPEGKAAPACGQRACETFICPATA
jgi:hypothetical protein